MVQEVKKENLDHPVLLDTQGDLEKKETKEPKEVMEHQVPKEKE